MTKNDYHRSAAWLLIGISGSKSGTLTLSQGRLSFVDDDQKCVFDAPVAEVRGLEFPWHYFGGGVHFWVGGEKYRVSFVQPHYEYGMAEGLERAKGWKPVLVENITSAK